MSGTLSARFRPRVSAGSGFGVSPLAGFTPASGGFTGDGIVEAGALDGTAQDRLSALAGFAPAGSVAALETLDGMTMPKIGNEVPMLVSGDATDNGAGGDYGAGQAEASVSDGMFMAGGYTGPGHPAEPAGTVHKGEVVIPAHQVARYGLRPLMALVEGQVPASRLATLARG